MRDITLGDTFYHDFTTRQFSDGVPTVLSNTPVLSVLEENNATPITSGVSVSVDRASVVGLNEATIIATGGNGYEAGKSYSIYISTGTVGGVSVIGEVVGQFTVGASAAAVDLANGTDGLGAIKTVDDAIKVATDKLVFTSAGRVDANMEAINDNTTAAVNLKLHALETMPVTFTTSGGSTSAAVLNLVDGSAASGTNDKYIGRILIFNVGTLDHEVAEIQAYVGATKTATISLVTTAPTSSHTARMV